MPQVYSALICLAVLVTLGEPALAAQGPGTSPGTAGPVAQWLGVLCGIGLATLGVVFAAWDDGTYGDF
jgi:hypothetical protein